ncbi:MAG: AAA family ATPase [Planctomycetota bacterium]
MRTVWTSETSHSPYSTAISQEEVDRTLADPDQWLQAETRFYTHEPEAVHLDHELTAVEERLEEDERWSLLALRLDLDTQDLRMLAVTVAAAADPQLGRVYAYLHDQPEMIHATPWLAATLYGPGASPVFLDRNSSLVRWGLIGRVTEPVFRSGSLTAWSADPALTRWLLEAGDEDLPRGAVLSRPEEFNELPRLYPKILTSMLSFAAEMERGGVPAINMELLGPPGSGRRTLAGQFAALRRQAVLVVSESVLLRGATEGEIEGRVVSALRAARLRNAVPYWAFDGQDHPQVIPALSEAGGLMISGRLGAAAETASNHIAFRTFELPPLTQAARLELWTSLTSETPPAAVHEWLLTPAECLSLHRVAHTEAEAIRQACRRPTESHNLLVKLPLPFEKRDLVLPESIREQLDDFEQQVRYRWSVYEEWGFERLCPNGRGIVALFAGPSGTGKTMAVQVLARSLDLELYRLDPANVVNKYIGETEKRLKTIFDEFDRGANYLLLIDECEGMFGQRFASKDAHDRYANLEIDYLLQRLERFQGVAVLATNRKGDMDSAFLRRLRMVIDFLPPGPAERLHLWRSALLGRGGEGARLLDGLDWETLAEKVTLTGAEIKLTALNAAFLARARNERIGMKHVLTALRREMAKKGQTLRGFE